jgi:glycosyltransferase involved in cell wall biosynthesis
MKGTIIIPTRNEAEGIEGVIRSMPKGYEVLVVDKSEDNTAGIAKRAGARVVLQKDRGKGNAMKLGAREAKGDIIVFIDGDGTYPANRIDEMVDMVASGKCDVVNGSRLILHSMKRSHMFGNRMLSLIASLLYGHTDDLLTGMRAMKRKTYLDLGIKATGFEVETEIHIRTMKNKLKVKEIAIDYHERVGEAKLNSIKDGWRILKTMFRYLLSR